jgi:hypothetical protein
LPCTWIAAFLQHPAARCSLAREHGKAEVWFSPTFFWTTTCIFWKITHGCLDGAVIRH